MFSIELPNSWLFDFKFEKSWIIIKKSDPNVTGANIATVKRLQVPA